MSIRYIKIKHSYTENRYSNYEHTDDVNEFVELIKSTSSEYSIFEVLKNFQYSKVYFDIENIDYTNDKLIYEIIDELKIRLVEYFRFINGGEPKSFDVVITKNINSQTHPGLSYHVIFSNLKAQPDKLKQFVIYYVSKEYKGHEYIDPSVYSKDRLFRCVNQPGVNKKDNDNFDAPLVMNDKHTLITDNKIEDSIISYIDPNKTYYTCAYTKISNREMRQMTKTFKREHRGAFSNNYMNREGKQIFIFNHPVSKEEFEALTAKKESRTGSEEYNKAVALSELITENETNRKMITLLKEFKEYYEKNGNYTGYRLSIEQIASIERIIEAKL